MEGTMWFGSPRLWRKCCDTTRRRYGLMEDNLYLKKSIMRNQINGKYHTNFTSRQVYHKFHKLKAQWKGRSNQRSSSGLTGGVELARPAVASSSRWQGGDQSDN
uniref:Uncharacterized protein n=1 Tax=Oryza punctata TaxID=4537 RepID=A0A0E0JJA5_ORYPU